MEERKINDDGDSQSSPRSPLHKEDCFDASKQIERSQSDAILLGGDSKLVPSRTRSVDHVKLQNLKSSNSFVSECSRVYLDLSNVEGSEADDDDVITPTSKHIRNKKKLLTSQSKILMTTRGLETIQQESDANQTMNNDDKKDPVKEPEIDKDVISESNSAVMLEFLERYPFHRGSMGDFDDNVGSIEPTSPEHLNSSESGCFYTKYPLRFPHGYSLSKYRHNLKLSYQTLSQRLEQQIVQIRGENTLVFD